MLSVVIVDDEALSRMELKSMLNWEKEGFRLSGEAENGKAGLEAILQNKPDIVITDIKMPVMDGLEMIRLARSQYDGARYIILSSYEEFALLKTAMRYGVADYLIKLELTPDILKKTLFGIRDALLRERDGVGGRDVILPASEAARMLRKTLVSRCTDDGFAQVLKLANPSIDPGRLSCIAVRFSLPRKTAAFHDEDRRTMEMAAHSIVSDIVKPYYAGVSFLADTGLCLFVYTPTGDGGRAVEMGEVIINMLRQYFNMASAVGLAGNEGGAGDIAGIMEDAIRATDEVFYFGYGKVLRAGESERLFADGPPAAEWSEPLLRALELRSGDGIRTAFDTMLSFLSGQRPPTKAEAFGLCFSAVGLTLSALKKDSGSKGFFEENLYEIIGEIETLSELRNWLDSFRSSILELFDSIPEKTGDDYIVTAAKRYIMENRRSPVNLNDVAEHLSISTGYLSSVFKRKANMGFVEYVTKVRMSEAKSLLLSGSYKIYEVSGLVGFEDPSYFIKTFHKCIGLTPKEYIAKHT